MAYVRFLFSPSFVLRLLTHNSLLHGLGIYFFTKGFLLTRLVLDNKSSCDNPPFFDVPAHSTGCWHPQTFDKAVVIIVDALRYDFTVPRRGSTHHFHNAFKVLHETAVENPQQAFLLPFIADPPTATLQRLKGLTTGNLPAFIDAGSNFAGTAIEEDNLLVQLRDAGRTMVHLGDDTWHSLFPGYFDANLTRPYDSFNVWDLYTVDDGVKEHLMPLLAPEEKSRWDVIFGHFLGLDHAGHRYGPEHPTTNAKLREMDSVVREIISHLDEDTLLVVMGDHGMDVKGDHGGESDDEIEAALWMYSKKGMFGRGHDKDSVAPPLTAKERPVGQIDLVPTLSLLLGIPIPHNSLGSPISEAFVGPGEPDWKNLAEVNALAAEQIRNYKDLYSKARGLSSKPNIFADADESWTAGVRSWRAGRQESTSRHYEQAYRSFERSQKGVLQQCRALFSTFDVPSMMIGIVILGCSLLILAFFARTAIIAGPGSATTYLPHMVIAGIASALVGLVVSFSLPASLDWATAGLGFGSIGGFAVAFFRLSFARFTPRPKSIWGWMAVVVTLSQSIGFASNSYTIWEDEILLFLLISFAAVAVLSSARRESRLDRYLGVSQSLCFGLLMLLASYSRLCREEQMPLCRSTYYASSTSSTSSLWQLLIPFVVSALLPLAIKSFYEHTRSYQGIAGIWIGAVLRLGLLAVAIFWTLDAADDNGWLNISSATLKMIKIILARLILGVSLVGGVSAWVYTKPCISIKVAQKYDEGVADPKAVQIDGSSNAHGTRYYLLVSSLFIGLALLQKPMGTGALAILAAQLLSLSEIISTNNLSHSAIGPIVLAALGNFHFFKTGHQATLSSIQWESAFIPLSSITYPFSPLLVTANAFGAQILSAIAVPMIVLWKQPPRQNNLMGSVSRALATFLLYHATINFATTMWAGHLRRHLMLFRIFSPRFLTGVGVLMVVDLVAAVGALASFWFNCSSVAEIFGWA